METFSLSRADLLPLPFNSFVFVERIHGSPQLALFNLCGVFFFPCTSVLNIQRGRACKQ